MLRDSERGATAVIVAASAILLVSMAAIAIDLGAGFNERRQDQTAADASALGGGVELIRGSNIPTVVAQIKGLVDSNLGRTVALSEWVSCTDPDSLGYPNDAATASSLGLNSSNPTQTCISFSDSSEGLAYGRVRVRVPDQNTDTSFAQVMGFNTLVTSASAEVELGSTGPYRNIPSFVFAPATAGEEFCIRTGTGASAGENCQGSATGNFGVFQPYFYLDDAGLLCDSGNQSAPNGFSIAEGLDHQIAPNPGLGNPPLENGADCPVGSEPAGPANPNQIRFSTGNDPNVTDGLVKGYTGPLVPNYTGRLTRETWSGAHGTAVVFGEEIDNRPLWTYIDNPGSVSSCADAAAGPASLADLNDGVAVGAFEDAQDDLLVCLGHPNVPADLFDEDIYLSPRLATVPKLYESVPCGNASCLYNVIDIVPVFVNSLWTNMGPQWTCDDAMYEDPGGSFCRHDPGREGTLTVNAAGQQKISSVSGILLSCAMLPGLDAPEEKCKQVGAGGNTANVFLNQELVK